MISLGCPTLQKYYYTHKNQRKIIIAKINLPSHRNRKNKSVDLSRHEYASTPKRVARYVAGRIINNTKVKCKSKSNDDSSVQEFADRFRKDMMSSINKKIVTKDLPELPTIK